MHLPAVSGHQLSPLPLLLCEPQLTLIQRTLHLLFCFVLGDEARSPAFTSRPAASWSSRAARVGWRLSAVIPVILPDMADHRPHQRLPVAALALVGGNAAGAAASR